MGHVGRLLVESACQLSGFPGVVTTPCPQHPASSPASLPERSSLPRAHPAPSCDLRPDWRQNSFLTVEPHLPPPWPSPLCWGRGSQSAAFPSPVPLPAPPRPFCVLTASRLCPAAAILRPVCTLEWTVSSVARPVYSRGLDRYTVGA